MRLKDHEVEWKTGVLEEEKLERSHSLADPKWIRVLGHDTDRGIRFQVQHLIFSPCFSVKNRRNWRQTSQVIVFWDMHCPG